MKLLEVEGARAPAQIIENVTEIQFVLCGEAVVGNSSYEELGDTRCGCS